MEYISNCPMILVDDVMCELRHLSSLCHVIAQLQDHHDTINSETVGDAMCLIRDCLDAQIKVLDSIQWTEKKTVGA